MRSRWIPGRLTCTCADAERGFTLIEAAAALAILGVAAVALLHAVSHAMRAQTAAERRVEALAVAEWKMNEVTALPLDSLRRRNVPQVGEAWIGLRRYGWRAVAWPEGPAGALWHARVVVHGEGATLALETLVLRRPGPGNSRRGGAP